MTIAPPTSPIEAWPSRIVQTLARDCTLLKRGFVVRETDSTQDAARRMNAVSGDVVIAWRQTVGRGRLGRRWLDTAEDGVAFTAVTNRDERRPQRLAIAAAVGVALAAESMLQAPVQIKWPNDILVNSRKLAGILIEQFNGLALIGVGLNVRQTVWPPELAHRAVSLARFGARADRLEVLCEILPAIDKALQFDEERLVAEFTKRDALRGKTATFRCGEHTVIGIVQSVHPLRGLEVATVNGDVWLDALATSVIEVR